MDVRSYISSGILEDFALGAVSDQERREVECLSKIYPEIREALDLIESDLESFAKTYAEPAPGGLKERTLARLHGVNPIKPVSAKVISLESEKPTHSQSNLSPWLVAACIAFAMVSGWMIYENRMTTERAENLASQNEALQDSLVIKTNKLDGVQGRLIELYTANVDKVVLASTREKATEYATVFWNTESGEIKMDLSKLPTLPADQQYQLWALKDGSPIDMGVLPIEIPIGEFLVEKMTLNADAFAITIETLGGNPTPNLEQLVVMGAAG